jgi:indole-3-glycerol phosphate synthase
MIGFPRAGYSVLGVNNRDLTTFEVDVNTTIRLAALAGDVPIISESGIKTRRDVERLRDAGVKAMLVGETLMRAPDVAAEIEQLLGAA